MTDVEPRGAVHWIDHYVVGTNDLSNWADWANKATGLPPRPINGLTTNMRKRIRRSSASCGGKADPAASALFSSLKTIPRPKSWARICPRCGFYIWPEDIDRHVRRLEQHKIPHTDPVKTAAEGEEGTVVYFADPDGNQYEFWAPVKMPEGAMEICTEEESAASATRSTAPASWPEPRLF